MGSFIEINDTLRITKEQGFPAELDLQTHLANPYTLDNVKDKYLLLLLSLKSVSTKFHPLETF